MNDVIPECGGYLVVRIEEYGYIKCGTGFWELIHRETRDLHTRDDCFTSFAVVKDALKKLPRMGEQCDDLAVLELTSKGGGAAIWMREDQVEELSRRRDRWRGCYGSWPIHTLSI